MKKSPIHTFEKYLKHKSLKLTHQRQVVVQTFSANNDHVSAEDLYRKVQKKYPEIGFTTVYRTLNLLVEAGIASANTFKGSCTLFEIIDKKEHHDHLICTKCGAIIEFHNNHIEELQESVAKDHGFRVTEHTLEIFGICAACK
jgi:Fur family ferric uptake transcriptional regulator